MDGIILLAVVGGIVYVFYKSGAFGQSTNNGPQPQSAGGIGAGGTVANPQGYTGIGSGPYAGTGGIGNSAAIPMNGTTNLGTNYTTITVGPGAQGVTGLSVNGSLYNATDPIGPGGQTMSELLGPPLNWTISEVADYIGMSGV